MTGDLCVSASRSQQLCVKLEPRGLLYVKLSLQEKWDTQVEDRTGVFITAATVPSTESENSRCSSAHQQLVSADQRVWSGTTPPGGEGERCSPHPSAHPEVCEGDRSARTQSRDDHLSLTPSAAKE